MVVRHKRQVTAVSFLDEQSCPVIAVRMTTEKSVPVDLEADSFTEFFPDLFRRDRILRKDRPSGVGFRLETKNSPELGTHWASQEPTDYVADRFKIALGHSAVMRQFQGKPSPGPD